MKTRLTSYTANLRSSAVEVARCSLEALSVPRIRRRGSDVSSAVSQLNKTRATMVSAELTENGPYGSYTICEAVTRWSDWAICDCTEG